MNAPDFYTWLADWLAMGGYGLYVWGSVGMCAAVFAIEGLSLRVRRRALLRELAGAETAGEAPASAARQPVLTRQEAA